MKYLSRMLGEFDGLMLVVTTAVMVAPFLVILTGTPASPV